MWDVPEAGKITAMFVKCMLKLHVSEMKLYSPPLGIARIATEIPAGMCCSYVLLHHLWLQIR